MYFSLYTSSYLGNIENKYVAYCDILGFSNFVLTDFDKVFSIYRDFKKELDGLNLVGLKTSVYSDSIIIVGDKLVDVAKTTQLLVWRTLGHNWLIRGGIAYGKHWRESDENNLFIVSEALVKAVEIEKKIKYPIIAISNEISIGIDYWINGFVHEVFDLPIIHYNDLNIVNPFNNHWFKSAEIMLSNLKNNYPEHSEKHNYLLDIIDSIKKSKEFVPRSIIDFLLERNIIGKL